MTEPHTEQNIPKSGIPTAIIKRRRVSVMWVIPMLALAVVAYLTWSQVMRDRGPMITITFDNASGIEPGSEIIHKGVTVGIVRDMLLTTDLQSVSVTAELRADAAGLAVVGTSFWIVRPEVSLERIAGLETLVGPQYIAMQPGDSSNESTSARTTTFTALNAPPRNAPADPGALRLTLRTDRLGNLGPASPVLYREIPVGSVRSAVLNNDSTHVLVTINIQPRYAPLVHANTKFWRSGGVGFDFGLFTGLSVEADSLDALLNASISLATPESQRRRGDPATTGDTFELEPSLNEDWLDWAPEIDLNQD